MFEVTVNTTPALLHLAAGVASKSNELRAERHSGDEGRAKAGLVTQLKLKPKQQTLTIQDANWVEHLFVLATSTAVHLKSFLTLTDVISERRGIIKKKRPLIYLPLLS